MHTILTIIFICIFVATAVIALASLPGWIKIPEGYRKALFTALLLEVISCIFIMYKRGEEPQIEPKYSDWIAIRANGELFSVKVNDSLVSMSVPEFASRAQEINYTLEKSGNRYFIKNKSGHMGQVHPDSLKRLGLFNGVEEEGSEFSYIRYVKSENNRWEHRSASTDSDLKIAIVDSGYEVYCGNDTIFEKTNFNQSNRRLLFIRDTKYCYLVRVGEADLSSKEKAHFITFFVIRFKPALTVL